MAKDLELSNEAANDALDALCANLNTGYIRIYSGTKPATADTALSGNTLLAELRFGATAFGASVAGVATANAITADTTADATGTAAFARCLKSDGTSPIYDGTVGVTAGQFDFVINSTAIQANAEVAITSLTLTLPKGV